MADWDWGWDSAPWPFLSRRFSCGYALLREGSGSSSSALQSVRPARAPHPHDRRRPNPLPFSLDDPRPRTLVLVVMITRRLAPRSVDDALLTDSGRTRAPVHIPGFHVALAKDHLSRLGPSGVISQEGDATVRLSLARRRASCHDPRGAVIRLFEARAGPTRRRVVVPFLKVGGPGATLRHGCGGDVGRLWVFLCSGRLDNEGQIYRREGEARWSMRGEEKIKIKEEKAGRKKNNVVTLVQVGPRLQTRWSI